jgi:PAS domain S-box-containing protein
MLGPFRHRPSVAPMSASATAATAASREPDGPHPWDGGTLLGTALAVVVALVAWVWFDWYRSLADAGAEFVNVAQANALRVSVSTRDARRLALTLDARIAAGQPPTPALLRQGLRDHFKGDEIVDHLPAVGTQPPVSSSPVTVDPARWEAQLRRVSATGGSILGWAYERGGEWMLPVFYRRSDGSVLVISLPMMQLLAEWVTPNVDGPSALGMRGFDERILARVPFTREMLGSDASQSASARAIRDAQQRGQGSGHVVTPATETDNVVRLIAWAEVPGTEARVLVASARDNLLARWFGQRWASFALAIGLLLASMALVMRSRAQLLASARAEFEARLAAEQAAELVHVALDASREATWRADPDSGAINFDADLSLLLGLEPAAPGTAASRTSLHSLLAHATDPSLRARLHEAIAGTCATGAPLYEEFSVRTRSLEVRHLVLRGKRVDVRGTAHVLGTLRDVTRLVNSQLEAAETLRTLERMCGLARIGPWVVDLPGGTLRLGPATREILELPADAEPGLWLDFPGCATAAAQGKLVAARRALLSDGTGYDLLLPLRGRDGEERWVRSTAAAVRDTAGTIVRVDGAVQDVTESVLARQRQDANERRLRELAFAVSSSAQLVLMTDPEERITWCNAAFERVSGYTLDEIRGLRPGPFMQIGAGNAASREQLRSAIDAREPVRGMRLRNAAKDGRPYWVDLEVAPVLSDGGALLGFVGLQTDVTADIEREAALAQTQARYDLATRNASIGIWERDFRSRSTRWNSVMFQLTGSPPEAGAPHGKQLHERLHPDDRDRILHLFTRAARDPATPRLSFECRFGHRPGEYRWLRSEGVFERNAQGRPLRVVGTLLDITLERELSLERRARAEAEARSAAKTAFLSSMSHELRTPLNAIIGYAQLLGRVGATERATVQQRVKRIETAGWHLLGLIDDILDLARIEAGNSRIEAVPVPLHEAVSDAIDLVTPQAGERGVTMRSALQPAWALGDAKRLRQVVVNLLSNAVKYNTEAGSVSVDLMIEGETALLVVQDSGIGMDTVQQARLFQPFDRLGREASGVQGTGIGLSIAKSLVERMAGAIEVQSTPGRGSTFLVRLPAVPAPQPAQGVASDGAGPAPDTRRLLNVLCVEDNEVNALLLEEAIRLLKPGWRLRRASSLAAATAALQEAAWDVMFLDENLPDGGGLRWLAGPPARDRVTLERVVLLSADASPDLRARAAAQGITRFMPKPFELGALHETLDSIAGTIDAPSPAAGG